MARWATLAEIAGISYTGCRVKVIEGEGLFMPIVGTNDFGNDGTVDSQLVNRGVKGIPFGINMLSAEESKLTDTIDAINDALGDNLSFVVEMADGIYVVNLNCQPDWSKGKWMTHGEFSEGWYDNVTWWFMSQSQGA